MPNPYNKSFDDKWSKEVTNSKIARTIVAGGLLVSFTLLITRDILKGTKNIITKPIFRKKKNVRSSADLY
jgi:hypothetical protein